MSLKLWPTTSVFFVVIVARFTITGPAAYPKRPPNTLLPPLTEVAAPSPGATIAAPVTPPRPSGRT